MDESQEDQRTPHRLRPNRPVSLEQLRRLGVAYRKVNGGGARRGGGRGGHHGRPTALGRARLRQRFRPVPTAGGAGRALRETGRAGAVLARGVWRRVPAGLPSPGRGRQEGPQAVPVAVGWVRVRVTEVARLVYPWQLPQLSLEPPAPPPALLTAQAFPPQCPELMQLCLNACIIFFFSPDGFF